MVPNFFFLSDNVIGIDTREELLTLFKECNGYYADCQCCPDDGSGNPVVSIIWNGTSFEYTGINVDKIIIYRYDINDPTSQEIIVENGTISGTTPGYNETSDGFFLTCAKIARIYGENKCGVATDVAICYCLPCYATFALDCPTKTIAVTYECTDNNGYIVNGKEVPFTEYYLPGDMPESIVLQYIACGEYFTSTVNPPCHFKFNSGVVEISGIDGTLYAECTYSHNFSECPPGTIIGNEAYRSEAQATITNLSCFNGVYIYPKAIIGNNISCNLVYQVPNTRVHGPVVTYLVVEKKYERSGLGCNTPLSLYSTTTTEIRYVSCFENIYPTLVPIYARSETIIHGFSTTVREATTVGSQTVTYGQTIFPRLSWDGTSNQIIRIFQPLFPLTTNHFSPNDIPTFPDCHSAQEDPSGGLRVVASINYDCLNQTFQYDIGNYRIYNDNL